ncbi:MAG: type II toxin-antitoxin system RelE/ParE family toxin [Pseudomonadota bacterium]
MKVRWSASAKADLQRIRSWLQTIENAKPDRTIVALRDAAEQLARHDIGRPGELANTRALSALDGRYVLAYERQPSFIRILAVYHTAQNR